MRLSEYFLPTLKETPKEAEIVSHRYMLRAGMIKQTSAGIYATLPLGYRVLRKIEDIIRQEQDRAGANEILMPTIQPADLWKESGRYDAYGEEMLRIEDRQGREMLFGPTNEEMVTDIFRTYCKSYKDLPTMLYQIQWKFRDEIRPRFGVMRGREFLMKDNYSFDLDYDSALYSYQKMFLSYLRTFRRMGLQAIPMRAETGPIGGDLSHEFIILAETGESEVFAHKDWMDRDTTAPGLGYDEREKLNDFFEDMTRLYAATDDMHDADTCPVEQKDLVTARGIEIGHIFYFGTKYSESMGATVQNKDGDLVPVEMGSYGIGVSRLLGAIIEASHDDNGIIWPESVAPFQIGLINLKPGSENCDTACNDLYESMLNHGIEVLYDDRDMRAGGKFADMDLIGLPWQVIIGPKGADKGMAELKNRATGEKQDVAITDVISRIVDHSSLIKRKVA